MSQKKTCAFDLKFSGLLGLTGFIDMNEGIFQRTLRILILSGVPRKIKFCVFCVCDTSYQSKCFTI